MHSAGPEGPAAAAPSSPAPAEAGAEGAGARERAPAPAAPGATSGSGSGPRRLSAILFHAEVSALYHQDREGFLAACHRLAMFAVLVSSSGAAVAIATAAVAPWLALVPALVGALDMTMAFPAAARMHASLAQRFLDLAADAVLADGSDQAAAELRARFYRICGEEPPAFEAVYDLAHNRAVAAVGGAEKIPVPRCKRLLRHLIRFSG